MASALARGAPPPERQGAAGGRPPGLSGGRDADRLGLRDGPRGERALVRCGCRRVGGSLGLISAAREFPVLVRATGAIAAVLFAIAAARIFLGARLTTLSAPLPFSAYPFLAIALLGWAWAHLRTRPAERCAVSVGPVDRLFATPPDSPGQCEAGLSDDRPRDSRLCYCPELSPKVTRSSSSRSNVSTIASAAPVPAASSASFEG